MSRAREKDRYTTPSVRSGDTRRDRKSRSSDSRGGEVRRNQGDQPNRSLEFSTPRKMVENKLGKSSYDDSNDRPSSRKVDRRSDSPERGSGNMRGGYVEPDDSYSLTNSNSSLSCSSSQSQGSNPNDLSDSVNSSSNSDSSSTDSSASASDSDSDSLTISSHSSTSASSDSSHYNRRVAIDLRDQEIQRYPASRN